MEYLSVKEAAEKWNISVRYVQRYCIEGRIKGAMKFGRSWAIPLDTQKPVDLRKASDLDAPDEQEALSGVPEPAMQKRQVPMPLLNTPYKLGHSADAIARMEDVDSRNIALAESFYFSGQSAKASDVAEPYLTSKDIALRVSACWIYAYANLALDRIPRARQAMAQLQATVASLDENTPPADKALAICVSTGASVLLHLPLPKILSPLKQYISLLPTGLKLFVLYIEAHHSYLNQQYGACVGIAETALALENELYPIPTIYLHLVAAMGYMSLRQPEQAKEHLLEGWKVAQPDDMIEAFGEHHGLLGGLLEATLKKDYPEDFSRIIDIVYSFSAGWRKIHNPDTGHHVADDLTTTEFAIAMLAARDWSNKEISSHLDISTNTVKMHISSALQKLGITQRKDLAQFMLK